MKEFICHPTWQYHSKFYQSSRRVYTDAPLTYIEVYENNHGQMEIKKPKKYLQLLDTFPALITETSSIEHILSIVRHYIKEKQTMVYINNDSGYHSVLYGLNDMFEYSAQMQEAYRFHLVNFNLEATNSQFEDYNKHYPHNLKLEHDSIDLLNPLFIEGCEFVFELLFGEPGKIIWAIGMDCRANAWGLDSDNLKAIVDYDNLIQWFKEKTWSLKVNDAIEDYLEYLEENHLTHQQACEQAMRLIEVLAYYEKTGVLNKHSSMNLEYIICNNNSLYISLPCRAQRQSLHNMVYDIQNNHQSENNEQCWNIHHLFYFNILAISKKNPEKTLNIINENFYQSQDFISKKVYRYILDNLESENRWIFHYYKSIYLEKTGKDILPAMNSLCLSEYALDYIQHDVQQWVIQHYYSEKNAHGFSSLPPVFMHGALYLSSSEKMKLFHQKKEVLNDLSEIDGLKNHDKEKTEYNLRDYAWHHQPIINKDENENKILFYISPKYKQHFIYHSQPYPLSHTLKIAD